ncbi:MAG: DUF2726 domain-containing protein [Syntrophotaleaceae bacterium]
MSTFVLLLAILFVLLILVAVLKSRQPGSLRETSYEPRELFSPAERSFLGVLEQASEGRLRIFGKVRLGDLVQPAKGLSQSQRTGAWNRIHQKHIDFVLCRPDSLAVVGTVELDDASHRRKDRAERDNFVDKVLTGAGISIIHFAARKGYSVHEVRAKLDEVLFQKTNEAPQIIVSGEGPGDQNPDKTFHELGEDPVVEKSLRMEATEKEYAPASNGCMAEKGQDDPICSVCNAPMVKRLAKKGPHAGTWFWACSAFPKCRTVQAID